MKSCMAFISALLALWILLSAAAHAETIVLAVPGPGTLSFLPVHLAKAIAADHAEGLELKLRYFSGGPLAMRDMMSNNSDFLVTGLPAIADARADGMPVIAIGQLSQSAMYVFLLRSDLKYQVQNISQLKGRRIGTSSGTTSERSMGHMLAEYLIQRAGLKSSDVQFIPTGQNREAQSAALTSAAVDAIMADEPFASELIAQGLAIRLADMYPPQQSRELLDGTVIRAAIATREEVYVQHPETVKKVMLMFEHTLQWLSTHSAREVVAKLTDQPGFDSPNDKLLADILQRNQGMFPGRISWDAQAVATTENFFHQMATGSKESNLSFADFVRSIPLD